MEYKGYKIEVTGKSIDCEIVIDDRINIRMETTSFGPGIIAISPNNETTILLELFPHMKISTHRRSNNMIWHYGHFDEYEIYLNTLPFWKDAQLIEPNRS